jgi:ubiquinone/menaquinone biosynthesis C-methylase UbiE
MNAPMFEETRPRDYLQWLAASGLGRAYKSLVASELGISLGDVVLDLGCGPGADLPGFAEAAGEAGRVIGLDNDPAAVREAVSCTTGLPQVEVLEGDIHTLDITSASQWLSHLAEQPFFASATLYIVTAIAG